ncbi:1,2-phenylacetyl-CoA epoxidase subunit PaaD [Egicoccus halophilus]|uniref:Phenylacetate-CoA oxygenase subunit PaaJ n=1 Tax=Egicoccus halophilus TaxID=1670830 RepID=A0A8J3ADC8_9ACTN|nr:1,2-phenylacetyl-CoA epoxidase subunit PaaD [Egicoccus halophilus]GGI09473.1 phenylacetate-CoA oxygenase subunit PaaJ [Egicoccus halophilus]
MTTGSTTVDPVAVRRAVEDVPDPELPPVTIGMLGMVHDLAVADDGTVRVELLPTFSGCPATEMIERDVVDAVREVDGVDAVVVRFRFDPPWTPDRIDATGRERLREFGIAPPGGAVPSPRPEGRPALPLLVTPSPAADADPRPCPYCGATDTVRDSDFGPTPCRDLRFCEQCQQPFEAFKTF